MSKLFSKRTVNATLSIALVAACVLPATLSLGACGTETTAKPKPKPEPKVTVVTPPPYGMPYDKLSEWNLFQDPLKQLPSDRVIPYEVISPLFSDYTTKFRFLWVPEGTQIGYSDDKPWDFPVGTILAKTFSYAADLSAPLSNLKLLETRILWRQPDGWSVHTYVWNADQTEAVSEVASDTLPSDFIDVSGNPVHNEYYVPNTNECKQCHTNTALVGPNGLKSRQMDRDHDYGAANGGVANQIDHLASLGLFSATPTAKASRIALSDPFGAAPLGERARSYLDANCSSCHAKGGSASQSSLLLDYPETDPATNTDANWGICKKPTSQGGATCNNLFDIVPGQPDQSILLCRVTSTEAKFRMPTLGVQLVYAEGVALLREWVQSMPPGVCSN